MRTSKLLILVILLSSLTRTAVQAWIFSTPSRILSQNQGLNGLELVRRWSRNHVVHAAKLKGSERVRVRMVIPGIPFSPPIASPNELIGTVAELGLKLKLKSNEGVTIKVKCSPNDLLSGRVEGVSVSGKQWKSPKMLTCQSLQVEVGETAVDMAAIARQRKILLKRPALGTAWITFSSADFANFLTHPLVTVANLPGGNFSFIRRSKVDTAAGRILFSGRWRGKTVDLALRQAEGQPATVEAIQKGGEEEALHRALGAWYNALEVDLDGAKLQFRSMRFKALGAVEIELRINVEQFPNPVTTSF